MENLIQLKCVKMFIKIFSLMDFDENFDAFMLVFIFIQYQQDSFYESKLLYE